MVRIAGTGGSTRVFTGQRKDFVVMRMDTFEYTGTYEYVNSAGTDCVYDFTDCIGSMQIKKKKTDTTIVRTVSVSFDETEYTLSVDAEDMDMDAGKYYYDLQIYDADSKMVTKIYGEFLVLQDVTSMEEPHDEEIEITLTGLYGYEKMQVLKENLLLSDKYGFEEGMKNKVENIISTTIGYEVQSKLTSTAVISSSIAYRLMTQWFKDTFALSSTVGYMATWILNSYNTISSEVEWTSISGGGV